MKKALFLLLLSVIFVSVVFSQTIRVGATPVPHREILEFLKEELKAEGINLEIVEFNDYVLPNIALSTGELDANFFQHLPYLESFTLQRGISNLVSVFPVHVEPMGFYLKKDYSQLKEGDTIVIPNDPTNEGRALLLLANNNVISLRENSGLKATVLDIVENPKVLNFKEIDAGFIPRVFKEDSTVVGAVINTNYAIPAGLNPLQDAVFIEGSDSPYANIITVRGEDEQSEWLLKLKKVILSEKSRSFITEKYSGAVVPVF